MREYRIWITSFIISLGLHLGLVAFMLYEAKHKSMDDSGLSGELSDSFQSIMMVSNLPQEEHKEVAINQKKSQISPTNHNKKVEKQKEIAKKDSTITDMQGDDTTLKSSKEISQNIESKSQTTQVESASSDSSAQIDSVTKEQSASTPRQDSQKEVTTKAFGSKSSDVANYQSIVAAHLNKYKKYPPSSLMNEEEGVVYVIVTLDSNGNVLSRKIKKGAKYETLNNETLATLDRASPLPAPPQEYVKNGKVVLVLPLKYNLKEYYATQGK